MADIAELGLAGVPVAAEHYDKVYDPLKDKTKQGVNKVKTMAKNRGHRDDDYSDYDPYEYDGPPRRSQTDGHGRRRDSDSHHRSGRGDLVERRYVKSPGDGGRAKSVGRDDYDRARGGRSDRRRG